MQWGLQLGSGTKLVQLSQQFVIKSLFKFTLYVLLSQYSCKIDRGIICGGNETGKFNKT